MSRHLGQRLRPCPCHDAPAVRQDALGDANATDAGQRKALAVAAAWRRLRRVARGSANASAPAPRG